VNRHYSRILRINQTAFAMLLLAGIGGLWYLSPPNAPLIAIIMMTLVAYGPLLLFAHAVIQGEPRQLTWLCFVLLFYFCFYVVQAFYPWPVNGIAALRITALVLVFVSAMLLIRAGRTGDVE